MIKSSLCFLFVLFAPRVHTSDWHLVETYDRSNGHRGKVYRYREGYFVKLKYDYDFGHLRINPSHFTVNLVAH